MEDPPGKNKGFAAARTCNNGTGALRVADGCHLCRISFLFFRIVHFLPDIMPTVLVFRSQCQESIPIEVRILARDSSLPRISRISVAPAGVTLLPETAMRTGHRT